MFKKNRCKRCGEKTKKKYQFCPSCGNKLSSFKEKDFGLLGTNDLINLGNEVRLPVGFNKLINSLMKNLEVEMKEIPFDSSFPIDKKNGISISISSVGNNPPKIKVSNSPNLKEKSEKVKEKIKTHSFNSEQILQFSKLEKQEPKTDIRRLSNKVLYEISLPYVKSLEDISINQLESSIEIKAISKKIGYTKVIPINLPLQEYSFSKGKLLLELGIKH